MRRAKFGGFRSAVCEQRAEASDGCGCGCQLVGGEGEWVVGWDGGTRLFDAAGELLEQVFDQHLPTPPHPKEIQNGLRYLLDK